MKIIITGESRKGKQFEKEIKIKSNKLNLDFKKIRKLNFDPLFPLKDIVDVCIFNVRNQYVLSLNFLSNYINLNQVRINGTKNVSKLNLQPLSNCINLQRIFICKNSFMEIDLTPLTNCLMLEELAIMNNKLKTIDLTPLSYCKELHTLYLSNNELSSIDLNPVAECKRLKSLWLSHNKLDKIDLSPLAHCDELELLMLNNNNLETPNLIPLANCKELSTLALKSNYFRTIDLAPLKENEKLVLLKLDSDIILTWSSALPKRVELPTGLFFKYKQIKQQLAQPKRKKQPKSTKTVNSYQIDTESQRLRKLRYIMRRTKQIRLTDLGKLLNFRDKSSLMNWLYFLSEEWKFTVKGDFITFHLAADVAKEWVVVEQEVFKIETEREEEKKLQCLFCEALLEEVEDERPIVCLNCGKKAPYCEICKNIIVAGEKVVQSTSCVHIFHKEHIIEWMKIKGNCPVCKAKISEETLKPYFII